MCCPAGHEFPVHAGVPLLVDDERCVISADSIVEQHNAFNRTRSAFERAVRRVVPRATHNVEGQRLRRRFAELMREAGPNPAVLLLGEGADDSLELATERAANSDLFLFPRTNVVCDAQAIPFADDTFDGIIALAVLEHVADPEKAVSEMFRVLKPNGVVLAETPFIQQVHAAAYDFTRFTDLGHRRLFRRFDEIERGASCGAGMALAWSYKYFLFSLVGGRSRRVRQAVTLFAYLTSFWLALLDRFTITRAATLDAASGLYFLGRKSEYELSDREIVALYRGAM